MSKEITSCSFATKLSLCGSILMNVIDIIKEEKLLEHAEKQGELERAGWQIVLVIAVMYVVLGAFFDGLSMMIMTLGIVFPLLTGFGFDPVWIGVFLTLMVEQWFVLPFAVLKTMVDLAMPIQAFSVRNQRPKFG